MSDTDDDSVPESLKLLICFSSDKEMAEWLKSRSSVQELKRQYPPSQHHCFYNTATRLVAIIGRS